MLDSRPVIVGMNNPYRSEAGFALYPAPERSAGNLLYTMVREAHAAAHPNADNPFLRMSYTKGFDRRNVLSAVKWSVAQGREAGTALASSLAGRRVVVCGRVAADCMGIPGHRPSVHGMQPWFTRQQCHGFAAWVVPHPSGLNREYNAPGVRERTGKLLLALYEGREP